MVFQNQELLLYTILAILIAIAFSLRRLYKLEVAIARLEKNIQKAVSKPTKRKPAKKKSKRRKR